MPWRQSWGPACEEIAIVDALVTSALASSHPTPHADLDRRSARAYALAPCIATLAGSRGSALIAIGRVQEGLAVLSKAEDGEAFNDRLVHAFRSLGHFELGQAEATRAAFAQAKALYKHEDWQRLEIERISRTIGEEFDCPSTLVAGSGQRCIQKSNFSPTCTTG